MDDRAKAKIDGSEERKREGKKETTKKGRKRDITLENVDLVISSGAGLSGGPERVACAFCDVIKEVVT